MSEIIVVGGGLSGLSAAHSALERNRFVWLLDKSPFCGGNSVKATSGINGAGTKTQKKLKIEDSADIFYEDTIRGGAKDETLAHVLTGESGSSVDWLQEKFNLDLSLVSRLGGHSRPRTHRGAERFPGMTITYRLLEKFEEEEKKNRCRLVNHARVTKLLVEDGICLGVEYERKDEKLKLMGKVILATGGYGADKSSDSLLKKNRPDLKNLPTTCGEHCTGDGIKLVLEVRGSVCDLASVQVHPTGLVNPKDPDALTKFLAAEALRGVGGIILNSEGRRFTNELGRRDDVTKSMWKNGKPPYFLCLNSKASSELPWHTKHYRGRGLMKVYRTLREFANEKDMDEKIVSETLKTANLAAEEENKNPGKGKFPAYPSGVTHDEFGKKYFANMPLRMDDEYCIGIITPVVHYTMGGIRVTKKTEVRTDSGIIRNLFASGETVGGIHGENRLGGSSLLDCVVFGRIAGKTASEDSKL